MSNSSLAPGTSQFVQQHGRRTTSAARPGSITVPEGAIPTRIHATCYSAEELREYDDLSVSKITELRGSLPVMWLDVVGLGSAEVIEHIGQELGLHRLAIEDVVNIPQRSKVEQYDENIFVVSQLPHSKRTQEFEQISFFVGEGFVLSWREHPGDCFDGVRKRLQVAGRPLRSSGMDYLLYALLDAVVDAYFPALATIGETLDELDGEMEQGATTAIVGKIHRVRHDVRLLRRVSWPLREAVNSLITNHEWLISQETSVYLRDSHDHTIRIVETLENYREGCSDLRDYYATEVNNQMNEVMKVLTVIATIFIPLSFIAGVYGMNFDPEVSAFNMPELKMRWGYPIALGLMAAVACGQLFFFRWRGWLGKSRKLSKKSFKQPN